MVPSGATRPRPCRERSGIALASSPKGPDQATAGKTYAVDRTQDLTPNRSELLALVLVVVEIALVTLERER